VTQPSVLGGIHSCGAVQKARGHCRRQRRGEHSIWEASTGKRLRVLKGHVSYFNAYALLIIYSISIGLGEGSIGAKILVRRYDERMAFVPEGQADSSQARSAWVTMERGSVPEGTVEVIVSSTDICRRN